MLRGRNACDPQGWGLVRQGYFKKGLERIFIGKDQLSGILWQKWSIPPFVESKPLSLKTESTQVLIIDRFIEEFPTL